MPDQQTQEQKAPKMPKVGDEVRVVLANGDLSPATLKQVDKDGKATIEFEHRGEMVKITSSPFDPEGKKPDCWTTAAAE